MTGVAARILAAGVRAELGEPELLDSVVLAVVLDTVDDDVLAGLRNGCTSDELAAASALTHDGARFLVRALAAHGLADRDGDRWRATARLDGVVHQRAFWRALPDRLRGGPPPDLPSAYTIVTPLLAQVLATSYARVADVLDRLLPEGGHALDVGAGWCPVTRRLAALGSWRVTALDRADVLAALEADLSPDERDRIALLPGDLLKVRWPAADLVLLAGLLYLFPPATQHEIAARAATAVAPGGHVAIVLPAVDPVPSPRRARHELSVHLRTDGSMPDRATLLDLVGDAGLDPVHVDEAPDDNELVLVVARRPAT